MAETELSPLVIGQLIENMKRGTEDRQDIKLALGKLNDGQEAMRRDMAGLQQSSITQSNALTEMLREKHGERISKLEESVFDRDHESHGERLAWAERKIKKWDGWIGSGQALAMKIAGIILSSAVIQAAAYAWLTAHK